MKFKSFIATIVFVFASSLVYGDVLNGSVGTAQSGINLADSYDCIGEHRQLTGPTDTINIKPNDYQRIASINLNADDSTISISSSNGWKYKYYNSERSYGIDAVLYLLYEDSDPALIGFAGAGSGHSKGSYNINSSIQFTVSSQASSDSGTDFNNMSTFEFMIYTGMHSETWLLVMANILRYGLGGPDGYDTVYDYLLKEYFQTKPIGARLDLYLVLPDISDYADDMLYAASNEYKDTITISGSGVSDTTIEISGNYTNVSDDISVVWTITQDENNSQIVLNDQSDIAPDSGGRDIGDYSYTVSMTSRYNTPVDFYTFLSSSEDATIPGNQFTLSNDNYSFSYQVGLTNNTSTTWFDGRACFDKANLKDGLPSAFDVLGLGTSNFSGEVNRTYSGSGDIRFRLTSGVDINLIPAGTYTSDIYFHVIATL